MAKPESTASKADITPEPPPPAPASAAAPVKTGAGPEVAAAPVATPPKAKSEKALRLAQALRANLKRRKIATRPARLSN